MFVQRVVVPRWIQLVILPLALLGLWDLARTSGSLLLIVVAASLIALILNPLSKFLEHVMPRGLAILASYLVVLVVIGGVVFVLADPIANQVDHFSNNFPMYIRKANDTLASIQTWFNNHGIRVHIKHQGESALTALEHRVTTSSGSIVSFSRDVLGKAISFGADLVLTFVLSVYLLVYAKPIGRLVRRVVPPGDGTAEDDFPTLIQRAVSGYVRGQLLFSVIMGASATLALYLFGIIGLFPDGKSFGVFFGTFYGLMELIPYVGPVIGPIPAVLVALFTNPVSAIWVIAMFIGLQQLEGHVVAPLVFRLSLRINPILVILSLLIGFHLYGIVGALLALPVAAVIRQTVIYMRRHLTLESWGTEQPPPEEPTGVLAADLRQRPGPGDAAPASSSPPGDTAAPPESALPSDLHEPVDEEGCEQQEDDGDREAETGDHREHQRHHPGDARH